jgi:hypothetical protein
VKGEQVKKYTRPVRRGFALMLERGLGEYPAKIREWSERQPRAQRLTAGELDDLQAAIEWITEQADTAAVAQREVLRDQIGETAAAGGEA